MVNLSILETETPGESLIIGKGVKAFAYRFRPYSRWPRGSHFKVFTTIEGTEVSVDECRVNAEGEVFFRVKGNVGDAKAFVKEWIEREGWAVSNPIMVTKNIIEKSEKEAVQRAEVETGGRMVHVEKIGEEKIDGVLQLWRVSLEIPGEARIHHSNMSNPTGYRVGEPLETNALKVIDFEVRELGNTHLLTDLGKILNVPPSLDPIKNAITQRFGEDAIATWLCDTPGYAQKRYGPGEAYTVTVPKEAIVGSDLGADGKLWIWAKEPEATRRWQLRAKVDELVKEIRKEKVKHGI